jgi:uncharacterized cupin superfamily protein
VPDADISVITLDRAPAERFQRLAGELGVSSFGINLIVLAPRQCNRIHAHRAQEEAYVVLEGELTLLVEGAEHRFGPDSVVRVGAAVRRQLTNAGTSRVVLLALGGAGEHVGRDGAVWESWEEGGPGRPPQEVPAPADLPA